MKKFLQTIAACLIMFACVIGLAACDSAGNTDAKNIIGTWQSDNGMAAITRIQFTKDADWESGDPLRGNVSYYPLNAKSPEQGSFFESTDGDKVYYTAILGTKSYKCELVNGKLKMSLEDNSFNETFSKKYD